MSDIEDDQLVRFIWRQDNFELSDGDVSCVKMLIAPARSVWDDFLDNEDDGEHTVSYDLQKMENGNFVTNIPLKINTYHFLFRVDDSDGDLTSSCVHHVTYLANGRKLNYVNVGSYDNILRNQDTNDPADEKNGNSESGNPVVIDSRTSEPQPRIPGQRRKRMFACCYLD